MTLPTDPSCLGTVVQGLRDRRLHVLGYEHLLTIDRKQDFCELGPITGRETI